MSTLNSIHDTYHKYKHFLLVFSQFTNECAVVKRYWLISALKLATIILRTKRERYTGRIFLWGKPNLLSFRQKWLYMFLILESFVSQYPATNFLNDAKVGGGNYRPLDRNFRHIKIQ